MKNFIALMTLFFLSFGSLVMASDVLNDDEFEALIDEGGGVGNNTGNDVLDLIQGVCGTDYSCIKNYKSKFANAPDQMAKEVLIQELRSKLPH
jgi:hypothetical protein